MKSILKATAMLSSSSLVGIFMGLIGAKIGAIVLGPSGLGFMGLLQTLVSLALLFAGMGVGAGLIRSGANALAQHDEARIIALKRAAWLLCWSMGGLVVLIMTIFRVPISNWMLGSSEYAASVVVMGVVLLLSLAAAVQSSLLNAYHRIKALAQYGIFNSVIGSSASLTVIWFWRENGIIPAMIVGAAVSLLLSFWFVRREIAPLSAHSTFRAALAETRGLLRFGVPYTGSMLLGTGVQIALPILILHTLNTESVGFYRAAATISISYLGFLLAAMSQDYYPRLAAVGDHPEKIVQLVNQQHRLVMLLGVPLILGALALAPYLVPIIYSSQFHPVVTVLEWQLIGDLFKLSSWTMGFIFLVRNKTSIFFLAELSFGITILVTSWAGMRWFGTDGLGIAFLVSYIVLYLVNLILARREVRLTWTLENKLYLLGAILAALVIRMLPIIGLEAIRTPVALVLALAAGLGSLYVLWQEILRDRVAPAPEPGVKTGDA